MYEPAPLVCPSPTLRWRRRIQHINFTSSPESSHPIHIHNMRSCAVTSETCGAYFAPVLLSPWPVDPRAAAPVASRAPGFLLLPCLLLPLRCSLPGGRAPCRPRMLGSRGGGCERLPTRFPRPRRSRPATAAGRGGPGRQGVGDGPPRPLGACLPASARPQGRPETPGFTGPLGETNLQLLHISLDVCEQSH